MSIITVNNANDNGAGSLRDAISKAQKGDTIAFASSLANQKITLTTGDIIIKKNLTIDGAAAPNLTISGNKTTRIFSPAMWTDVTLKNLTIVDGKNEGKGGAIGTADSSKLTVDNVKFYNNVGGQGGAIQVGYKGKLTVLNSIFDGNDGTLKNNGFSAGAIATTNGTSVTIKNSQFTNNKGIVGGAVYIAQSGLTLENSVFLNNKSTAGGGALYTDGANIDGTNVKSTTVGGTIKISDSWFEGNETKGAGGALNLYIYNPDQVIVENSTIIGNTAYANYTGLAEGGGLRANGNVTVRNVTIANNVVEGQGGGLWLDGDTTSGNATINIENTTLSGNRAITEKGFGGGVAMNPPASATVNIVNSTIADNYAEKATGAIWAVGKNKPTLTNSIISNNSDPANNGQQVAYQLKDGGGNIEFPGPQASKGVKVTANSLVADPKLGALQNIDSVLVRPLLKGSAAINSGVAGATTVDTRGFTRDSQADVGAFEYGAKSSGGTRASASFTFTGTSARDVLTGTSNNDRIIGLQGADTLTGGVGNDKFIYTNINDRGDVITDFEVGKDKIVLTQLLDSLVPNGYKGSNAIADGYVKIIQGSNPQNFNVQIDSDGSLGQDTFKPFIGVSVTGTETLNNASNFVF